MKKEQIPQFVSKTVWYSDAKSLDWQRHKLAIIKQVLLYGDVDALAWIFSNYRKEEIAEAAKKISLSEWDKKSLALCRLYFKIEPKTREAQIKESERK